MTTDPDLSFLQQAVEAAGGTAFYQSDERGESIAIVGVPGIPEAPMSPKEAERALRARVLLHEEFDEPRRLIEVLIIVAALVAFWGLTVWLAS